MSQFIKDHLLRRKFIVAIVGIASVLILALVSRLLEIEAGVITHVTTVIAGMVGAFQAAQGAVDWQEQKKGQGQ